MSGRALLLTQLVEQRLGLIQIGRVEAFGEPAVDRCEEVAGRIGLTLRFQGHKWRRISSLHCPLYRVVQPIQWVSQGTQLDRIARERREHICRPRIYSSSILRDATCPGGASGGRVLLGELDGRSAIDSGRSRPN